MDVSGILTIPSLSSAMVIAGQGGLSHCVTGIMVLEAADIENWGNEGEVILTSYYALKDLPAQEAAQLFMKLTSIGISALIIKIDRFVSDIPHAAVNYCDLHSLPLIQIPRDVKYESVILEILGPIVNSNVALLNRHYDVHNKLTRMALKEPSLMQLLNELKRMISCDVTLVNRTREWQLGTTSELEHFEILENVPIPPTRYMNFQYRQLTVMYLSNLPGGRNPAVSVDVPNLEKERYELVIHNRNRIIGNDDFMVIENVVSFLQMELLKQYSISQNNFHRNNSLVSDLLNGRLFDTDHWEDPFGTLHIDQNPYYQVLMIQLSAESAELMDNPDWASDIFYGLKAQCKKHWMNIAYLEKQDRITFLCNFSKKEGPATSRAAREIMDLLHRNQELPAFHYQISISSSSAREDIPKLNQEVVDIRKVLHLFYRQDSILSYDDLGIYKLFLSAGNLEHPEHFIPPKLTAFRKEHPDLLETLSCFLETNQSFSETAAALYLHPKTIRYRINKIIQLLDFDLTDPEQVLQVQIASRLFKLMG